MWRLLLLSALAFAPCSGCGQSSGDQDDAPKKKAVAKKKEKTVPVAGKLGTFDDGRIEIPLLKEWRPAVKEEGTLARMGGSESLRLPGMNFLVKEYPDFETVGSGDVRKFARQRREEVREQRKNAKINVEPFSLGSFQGVQYSYVGRVGGVAQDKLFLETVVDGRLYTIEVQASKGAREEVRPAAYAVAKNLKFPKMVNKPKGGIGEAGDDGEATDEEMDKAAKDDEPADEE